MLASYDGGHFDAGAVAAAKGGRRVSVCLPARNEAATVGAVASVIVDELMGAVGVVDELVVVDDGSVDATARIARDAGAVVIDASTDVAGFGAEHGKGQARWRGLLATTGDVVVYCDADVVGFGTGFVLGLLGPLLTHEHLAMVKGFYRRPSTGPDGGGGRVTELVARPLVSMLFPHLGPLVQPLAGEIAARRDVLESVPFVGGYGVDLGLLIDVTARFGEAGLAQSDLGERIHRNRSLAELSAQSTAVLQVALDRAGLAPRGWGDVGPRSTRLQRPGDPVTVTMTERPPLAEVRARQRRSAAS